MIFQILENKYETEIESERLAGFIYNSLKAYMRENEYFDGETFVDFLEEKDDLEPAVSGARPIYVITSAQLEEWVDEISNEEDEELIEEELDPDPEDMYDDEDDELGDDDEE